MRTIDADALEPDADYYEGDYWAVSIVQIHNAPTIEPQRKKGMWIDSHTTCSECGWQMIDDVIESPNIVAFNFCPNCGADMREDGADETR